MNNKKSTLVDDAGNATKLNGLSIRIGCQNIGGAK